MNRTQQASRTGKLILTTLLGSGLLLGAAGQVFADGSHSRPDQNRWEERQQRHVDSSDQRSPVQARQDQRTQVVRELPRHARQVQVGKRRFYRNGDRFYSRHRGGFVQVDPPAGVIVARLPGGVIRINLGGYSYFRSGHSYYRPVRDGYLVVDPIATGGLHAPVAAKVRVAANILNVRTGPGRSYGIIGRVSFGEVLPINGAAPGWHRVMLPDGRCGWIMSRYAQRLGAG